MWPGCLVAGIGLCTPYCIQPWAVSQGWLHAQGISAFQVWGIGGRARMEVFMRSVTILVEKAGKKGILVNGAFFM